jgi:scyllo-inositol 2-dehydrogenase (NADP+)
VQRIGLIGIGKMGLSHCSMLGAHPDVELVGICDSSSFVLGVLEKYTGVSTFGNLDALLDTTKPDGLFIATPSHTHTALVRECLQRNVSVFCEKPFTLNPTDAEELVALSDAAGVTTQVGYHNRFVATFAEVKRLLDASAIGTVTHVLAEAYGPVVLRPRGGTWRSQRALGGGCLFDYAAHVIDLVTWYLGKPEDVRGTVLNSVFSSDIDDEVSSTLVYRGGRTAQVSANWSDESQRKMTTRITLWGTHGRIFADRQECQIYLRDTAPEIAGYRQGWNVRYTTELTQPVGFYLRGEEYSAQIEHFVSRLADHAVPAINSFASASITDAVIGMMIDDAAREPVVPVASAKQLPASERPGWLARLARRLR